MFGLEIKYVVVPCVCYPSVHCGLPASRVRSRAHLLKSVEKEGEDETRDLCMSECLSHSVLTLDNKESHFSWCQKASVTAAYMQVSCNLWCGGRVCTHVSCTWD